MGKFDYEWWIFAKAILAIQLNKRCNNNYCQTEDERIIILMKLNVFKKGKTLDSDKI